MESQNLSIRYIQGQPRWDFRYFDPQYLVAETALQNGKYPLEKLGKHVKQIVNFGAYSLCNLLVWVNEGVPYIRVTDMKEDGISWSNCPRIPLEIHEQLPKSKVYPGDVLYSMAGTIGLAVVVPDELGDCNSNQAIAKIRLKDSLSPHYLATVFNSRLGRLQSERIANGQTVLNINMGEIGELSIPLPPRPIQDHIATVMQDGYAQRRQKLAEAETLLGGIDGYVLQKLGIVTNKNSNKKYFLVESSRLVGCRFDVGPYANEFNTQEQGLFPWIQLKDLAEFPTEAKIASKKRDQEFNYIGVPDVNDKMGQVNIQRLLGQEIKANKTVFKGGDVVFARIEPCIYNRKIALIPFEIKEALGSTELLVARAKRDVSPEFLLWILRSELIQHQILGIMTGTTGRRRLPHEAFENLKVPKIPLNLQKEIGNEAMRRRDKAKELQRESETIITEAKAHVERMILGEKPHEAKEQILAAVQLLTEA